MKALFESRSRPYNPGMCESAAPLPDDLALCHEIIRQQADTIQESQRRIEQLEHQVELLLRRQYGPRRESVDPDQLRLFTDDAPNDVAEADRRGASGAGGRATEAAAGGDGDGRRLPEDLPRERIEYELSAEELPCPDCGHTAHEDRRGGQRAAGVRPVVALRHRQHARFRYACRACQEHVAIADKPPQPIDKGLPGPGLLAQTITSKYSDHLPLYRLEDIFARHGVELSRATLCGWMASCAELLTPLYDLMVKRVLALDGHPHRRHHGAGAGPDAAADPHRAVLGLHRGCPPSLRGLRLHAAPDAGRAGAVPQGVPRLPPGRRVLRLRPDLRRSRT